MLIVCVSPGYTYVPAARRRRGGMLAPSLLLLVLAARARALDLSACIAPLGMESGQIPDAAVSASSSYNDGSVAAQHARLNTERGGGAWCPREQIAPDAREWLEVDLRAVHVLTAVGTQGRFGNGQGAEFAEAFALEYWRPRLGRWVRYRTAAGAELLSGNSNTYLEARTQLTPPVWAQRVRFLPRSTHRRTVCMRVELYGCLWNEGVVAYSMPMGDTRASGLELGDAAYDGAWGGGELRGGLGLLVDGARGGDELREAARPSRWVGWRNETRAGALRPPPALTFEFDRVREFTLVSMHVSNRFMRDVRAPAAAVVRFSVGGRHYQQEAVRADLPPDDIFESARNVTLQLHRRIARFVRLELHFAARWLLVSEVSFRSELAQGNHSAERADPPRPPPRAPVATPRRQDPLYVAVLVGVLAALAILLAVAAFLLVQRHRHRKCFASPPPKGALASPARRAPDEYAACPAPDDYQEPYGALRRSYSTVLLEMEHLHSDATLPLEDSSVYEYAVPEAGVPLLGEPAAVPEVAPHRLRMISKLAEGAFGAVFVAEGEGVPEYGGGAAPGARLVAVKFLHAAAAPEERAAFERDVRVLAALAHPCLARVLGAARAPAALVLEYLERGDLNAALRALPAPPPAAALRGVAEQLAAGMAYLEALDFVHRDLAARNCVLGDDFRVKIADFGTDNEAYAADYVRVDERVVPLRWAAPEAALEGRHSTRADVWAWAVTVWEVYGLCRRRPLAALPDERVLAGLRRAVAGGRAELPARAPRCPRRLHRLLQACWRPEPRARPSFRDLHAALAAPDPPD